VHDMLDATWLLTSDSSSDSNLAFGDFMVYVLIYIKSKLAIKLRTIFCCTALNFQEENKLQ
jgi:hypothetical protein